MKKGWEQKRLGDVLEVQNGYAFDSAGFNPTKGMPLIRIRSLKPGTETETRFDGDYDKKYVVKAGDLLIGMDGEFGCYEWKGEPALLNQRVCRLQGFSGGLVPKFLFYGVNDYLKAIEDVTGYATVKHLSSKQILTIEFPVPPLPEQHRIVGLLDEAFEGLATAKANAAKNLQNAHALFESHRQNVFTQRGKGWVEKRLNAVAEFSQGIQVGLADQSNAPGKGLVRFIRITDYTQGTDDIRYVKDPGSRYWAGKSDIVMVRYGTPGLVGRGIEGVIANNLFKISIIDGSLTKDFLAYVLGQQSVQSYLSSQGSSTMPALTFKQLGVVSVPFPRDLEKQNSIVFKLDSLREQTQRLAAICQQKLAALETLKKSLLHQAFTGLL